MEQLFPEKAKGYFASKPLLHRIGEYAHKMRITGNWFVNFADAIPVLVYPPSLLYKYGELFNDTVMKQYAAFMLKYAEKQATGGFYYREALGSNGDLNEFMNYINTRKGIEGESAVAPEEETVWYPDIQVFNARSKGKLFLAGKAGNNHESHNHNDVGNFILFQNGHPVFIDIGVGTYTAQTFSSHRYDLFYMQSQYHNCPEINGINQKAGGQFNSKNVSFVEKNNGSDIHFTADISGAYPKEAHVTHWTRNLVFDRTANSIQLEDDFSLSQFVHSQKLHFILHESLKVTKVEHGVHLANAHVNMKADIDWTVFDLKEEVKSLEKDHHLTHVWGQNVKRLTLTTKEHFKQLKGHFIIKFSAI